MEQRLIYGAFIVGGALGMFIQREYLRWKAERLMERYQEMQREQLRLLAAVKQGEKRTAEKMDTASFSLN